MIQARVLALAPALAGHAARTHKSAFFGETLQPDSSAGLILHFFEFTLLVRTLRTHIINAIFTTALAFKLPREKGKLGKCKKPNYSARHDDQTQLGTLISIMKLQIS